MKICNACVLPEAFPGIKFNEDGTCNYCTRYKGSEKQEQLKERYKQKFHSILEETRNTGPYDVLMAHSGGKDSTLIEFKFDQMLSVIRYWLSGSRDRSTSYYHSIEMQLNA